LDIFSIYWRFQMEFHKMDSIIGLRYEFAIKCSDSMEIISLRALKTRQLKINRFQFRQLVFSTHLSHQTFHVYSNPHSHQFHFWAVFSFSDISLNNKHQHNWNEDRHNNDSHAIHLNNDNASNKHHFLTSTNSISPLHSIQLLTVSNTTLSLPSDDTKTTCTPSTISLFLFIEISPNKSPFS